MDGFSEKRCVEKKNRNKKKEARLLILIERFIIARFRSLDQRLFARACRGTRRVIVMYRCFLEKKKKKGIRGKGDLLSSLRSFLRGKSEEREREMIETRGLSGILPLYGGDTAARRKNREETCRATLICERLRAPGVPRCPPRDKETLAPA